MAIPGFNRVATTDYGVREHLRIEIGDAMQAEYIPQIKFKAWNNESNFSVRAIGSDEVVFSEEGDKLKLDTVFTSKPTSNTVRFSVQSKNVDFHYQPPLTQAQINNGDIRPDDVVGSYAVYTRKRNGKYKAGKLCHIYRPFVVDALGVREWCDMNITGGMMTVTIPQAFLDSAAYPVVLDPDFGYTTMGGTNSYMTGQPAIASVAAAAVHSAIAADTVTSISIGGFYSGSPSTQKVSIYSLSGIVPNARQLAPITFSMAASKQWQTTSGLSLVLTPGVDYTVACGQWAGSFSPSMYVASDTLTGVVTSRSSTLSDPWVETATNALQYSMYATYTAGTPAVPPSGDIDGAKYGKMAAVLGYDGHISDMEAAWLQTLDVSVTAENAADAWMQYWDSLAIAAGDFNDRAYAWLGGLGHTGSLQDRWLLFWQS